jgi:hypothetical protein
MLRMFVSENNSLRPKRLDMSRLTQAFVISIALHLFFWGGYKLNRRYQILERLHLPAWVERLVQPLRNLAKKDKPLFQEKEPPLMFVNVNPEQAVAEPPKNAAFYSSQNSKAANPEADKDTEVPKITGKQEDVPKTEDTERNKFPLQPALPKPQPEPEEHAKEKPKVNPGDLAFAKPETNPTKDTGAAEKTRPRRLADLPPEKQPRPPGPKMKLDGGIRARLENTTSLDAKATPFGTYDALLVQAISQRWYDLLDSREFAGEGRGKVVVQFKLHYDGRITDMKVAENTVSETLSLICQKAVLDPSPFERWPKELRLMVGEDYRKIQFTFYYY